MARINKYAKRLSRLEAQAKRRQQIAYHTQGVGKFLYQNRTGATLHLPKQSMDGKKVVGPQETWEGDSYYRFMVDQTHEAVIMADLSAVETPKPEKQSPKPKQENNMSNEKLILDQPDRVTTEGTVERVVAAKPAAKPLNESKPAVKPPPPKETLITDDASDGVDIIAG